MFRSRRSRAGGRVMKLDGYRRYKEIVCYDKYAGM
jgi:hypothetical protein